MTNCGQVENDVQEHNKKSTHFQMTNCGQDES